MPKILNLPTLEVVENVTKMLDSGLFAEDLLLEALFISKNGELSESAARLIYDLNQKVDPRRIGVTVCTADKLTPSLVRGSTRFLVVISRELWSSPPIVEYRASLNNSLVTAAFALDKEIHEMVYYV